MAVAGSSSGRSIGMLFGVSRCHVNDCRLISPLSRAVSFSPPPRSSSSALQYRISSLDCIIPWSLFFRLNGAKAQLLFVTFKRSIVKLLLRLLQTQQGPELQSHLRTTKISPSEGRASDQQTLYRGLQPTVILPRLIYKTLLATITSCVLLW